MYYDAKGRPDPNGHYEMRDGKLVGRMLRPGEHISFDLSFMDAAPSASRVFLNDGATTFTDAERTLADSAEGQFIIAQARASHVRKNQYLGDRAPQFTDAMASGAIRAAAISKASTQSFLDRCAADEPHLRAEAEAARHLNR
jgi:hypothetical protein